MKTPRFENPRNRFGGVKRVSEKPWLSRETAKPRRAAAHAKAAPHVAPAASHASSSEGDDGSTRLQVVLAHLGVDSRRHCASIISGGAVTVNGEIIREPGYRVQDLAHDVICVSGHQVSPAAAQRKRTILLNKPRGLVCASSDPHFPTVFECLDGLRERVVCCGRLDRDSDGLLVLSNDGDLVNRLTHPKFGHTKYYRVLACGIFDHDTLNQLQGSMEMDGKELEPVRVEYEECLADGPLGPRHRLVFVLREGRNRQIRRMCEAVGLRVEALTRIRVNHLHLPTDLKVGAWRDITPKEMSLLEKIDTAPLRPWQP